MRIGITYDLRSDYLKQGYGEEQTAEFDSIETIDAIDHALRSLGHETERIGNVHSLIRHLAAGTRWDLVFNIAEGMHGFGREAQIPALLDAFRIPYTFSDPLVLTLALHKGTAKRMVQSMGLRTPDFAVVHSDLDVEAVDLPWPVFAKPVAGGSSAGISPASKAYNKHELAGTCRDLMERFQQAVLVETFLPGREFTVGLVGTGKQARSLGAMEILLRKNAEPAVYSYRNKKNYKATVSYRLAQDDVAAKAERMALRIWTELGCRDSGRLDIRCDANGEPNFLEINPLAGLHPDSDLSILGRLVGINYSDLIKTIITSAQERVWARTQEGLDQPVDTSFLWQPPLPQAVAMVERPQGSEQSFVTDSIG